MDWTGKAREIVDARDEHGCRLAVEDRAALADLVAAALRETWEAARAQAVAVARQAARGHEDDAYYIEHAIRSMKPESGE